MDQKLQELTEKLYQEGVSKGNQQAEVLLANARKKSTELIAEAESKARAIIVDAEKKAAELNKNTRSELQLASKQMISAVEQEVVKLLTGKIVADAIEPVTSDKAFMQKLILSTVNSWTTQQDLLVVVSPADQKEVEAYFAANAKQLLNKGVKIESANGVKAGFQIGPADGSYKVSFTHDDFVSFFKEFIRPKVVELLFDRK
ncbi:MAG: V-type ATP synthase subunit E [Prolixibacteraceae bacterium]